MGSGAIVPLATAGRHYFVTPYRCNFKKDIKVQFCLGYQHITKTKHLLKPPNWPKITTVILIIIPKTLCIFAPKLII